MFINKYKDHPMTPDLKKFSRKASLKALLPVLMAAQPGFASVRSSSLSRQLLPRTAAVARHTDTASRNETPAPRQDNPFAAFGAAEALEQLAQQEPAVETLVFLAEQGLLTPHKEQRATESGHNFQGRKTFAAFPQDGAESTCANPNRPASYRSMSWNSNGARCYVQNFGGAIIRNEHSNYAACRAFYVACTGKSPNAAPVNNVAPAITGTATVGNVLTGSTGTWTDANGDSLTYTYQWYRADNNSGTNLASIPGATSASYTLTTSDAHKYLRVVVTANDGNGGTQTATSAYTQVTNSAPVNSVAPTISGTATVGNALTTTNGTWSDPDGDNRSFSYQWYRADDNSGTNLALIAGATSASYTLTTSDAHKYLRVVVTANDGNGGTPTVTSAYTQVTNSAPVNSVAPTISGTATVGNALTTTNGTWSDPDGDNRSFSYQWYRADDGSGTNLALIAGATSASYTLTTSDAHKYLRVVVTANDGKGGTQTASSAYTAVTNAPPTDMTLSNNSVSQRAGVNAVVGSLSSVDPDGDNAFTYSFATGSGDTDNASFNLSGAALRVNDPALLTAGNYSVRLRTTDGSGGTFEKEFAVTIAASLPPTIGGTPPSAVARAQAYSFTPTASSPEGDPLTFSIVNQPAWASFDPATGTLSGTPTLAHVGTTTSGIVISVSDGWLTANLAPFSIAVTEHPAVPPSGGWGGLGDNDADGIPDAVETLVPSVDGVSRGDGNGDGTPDVDQDHVTSIPWAQSPSGQLSFVTLSNASGLAQTGVSTTLPAAGDLPANLSMPYGLLSFEVNGVAPLGGAVSFSVYVDANAPVDGYYKKSSASGNWENIATGITTVGARKRIDFTLTDGDPFDTDGLANGRIVDPGGPGMMGAAAALTPIPLLSPWAMAALAALMAGGAGVAGGRRRRH